MKITCQFKRWQRLLKPSEFKRVFSQPYRSTDHYLTVLAKPNTVTNARLGLAIAKKQVKPAVVRNRIKRLVRESFRHHQQGLEGLDCVVLAKSGVEQVNNRVLLCSLEKHWQQLLRRCKKS